MDSHQKCVEFVEWFEDVFNRRPGMLGSVADISAMFFVVDNFNSLLSFGETLPQKLSWTEFLIDKKLLRNLKPIPVEDKWSFEKFVALWHEYLTWVKNKRAEPSTEA